MTTAQPTDNANRPAADFLTHLTEKFGWSEEQALDALSAYILSTEAGRALHGAPGSSPTVKAA